MDRELPISVIMPTYNTEISMLKEAVDSILNQTFRDFEFIIIDDGSTNGSDEYLNSLRDERIRIIRNPVNIGVTKSLNSGLRAAKGKYIARMDSDDISLPTRFEKQYAYMETHPEVVMCGSAVQHFGTDTRVRRTKNLDKDTYRIKTLFYYPGPNHPTIFVRSSVFKEDNLVYDESLEHAQDYQLYADIGNLGKVYIFREALLLQRMHGGRVSVSKHDIQRDNSMDIQRKLLTGLLNNITDEEVKLHYLYSYDKCFRNILDFFKCAAWYMKLIRANNRARKYPRMKFALYACKLLILNTALFFRRKALRCLAFFAGRRANEVSKV